MTRAPFARVVLVVASHARSLEVEAALRAWEDADLERFESPADAVAWCRAAPDPAPSVALLDGEAGLAALEALRTLERPEVLAAAARVEAVVREVFEPLRREVPALGDVRGVGAMMAIEFVRDGAAKTPWPEVVPEITRRALEGGVVLIRAGLYSNCVRFLPELTIPEAMLREALGVVADAERAACGAQAAVPT